MSMQMDAYLIKEQIGTLFVHVGLLHGGSRGGWVGQGGPDQFLGMTSTTFFPLPPALNHKKLKNDEIPFINKIIWLGLVGLT